MMKNYQRRHLRAPLRESVLYADGEYVLKARAVNLSQGGLLIEELPSFPQYEEVPLLLALPQFPYFKNFSILKLQTFSRELFPKHVIKGVARLVRKEAQANLEMIFTHRFGLEFVRVSPQIEKSIDDYVTTYASNLIYLQTLIDSYNTDEETRVLARTLAQILGYNPGMKIAELRIRVMQDYKSLQWS